MLVHHVAALAGALRPVLEGRQALHLERRELHLAAQVVVELRGERRHRLAGQIGLQSLAEGLHGGRRGFERAGELSSEVGRVGSQRAAFVRSPPRCGCSSRPHRTAEGARTARPCRRARSRSTRRRATPRRRRRPPVRSGRAGRTSGTGRTGRSGARSARAASRVRRRCSSRCSRKTQCPDRGSSRSSCPEGRRDWCREESTDRPSLAPIAGAPCAKESGRRQARSPPAGTPPASRLASSSRSKPDRTRCPARVRGTPRASRREQSRPRPSRRTATARSSPPARQATGSPRRGLESCDDNQYTPASFGGMTPQDAQEIWPLAWMVQTSRTVLSVRYSVAVQVAGAAALNSSTM